MSRVELCARKSSLFFLRQRGSKKTGCRVAWVPQPPFGGCILQAATFRKKCPRRQELAGLRSVMQEHQQAQVHVARQHVDFVMRALAAHWQAKRLPSLTSSPKSIIYE